MPQREPSARRLWRVFLEHTWQPEPPLAHTLAETAESEAIVDLGAGGRRVRPGAVCVDLAAGPNVDVIADIHQLPLPDQAFDLAICTGTLNLCREPRQVISEIYRVLRPGGRVHLEVGLFQPYLPEPEDYWRFTLPGLRYLFAQGGFAELRSGAHLGPGSAISSGGAHFFGRLFQGQGPLKKSMRAASHLAFGPVKYLDAWIPKNFWSQSAFAYGIYFVGQRPKT